MGLFESVQQAFHLLFSGDPELWGIVLVSLRVTLMALLIATPLAVVAGFILATTSFPGRRAVIVAFQSLLSFPTVVVGLLVYMMLSRHGPLGAWHLLFTPSAMVIGQVIIAFPILVAFTVSAVQGVDPRARETALSLGANRAMASFTTLMEVRFGVMAAVFSGFGRIISEVGCSLMVGGNIAGMTRNMPTAIALETSKGEFAQGIALGAVLLALALGINYTLSFVQGKGGLP
ncbi:MAG: ABC transporter permease [Burkholderiales bacterium]